ncbi:MAG: TetR/AcrR family transcriptional regulator [Halobacteriaceae archaeon]
MDATYEALLRYGYADLSISRIADEFGKSKSSLYYHYDSKDELLLALLEFATDRFEATVATEADDPDDELEQVIETLLPLELDEEERQLQRVLIDLRSRSVTNDDFRAKFSSIDDRLVGTVRRSIDQGIDEGVFRDVDSTRVAEHIIALINGAMLERTTTDRENAAGAVRRSLSAYIDSELRKEL